MAKTRRRVLSILMALVLTLGLLPTAALASGGNTTIRVVDQSGAPINGAEVTVERGYYHESNTTGDSGTVSFNLRYKMYSVSVSAFGYTGKTVYVNGSGTHTVQLSPSPEGSRDNPKVRFYVLDPDKGTPTDNNNENKGDYYPNDDKTNPDHNGGIPGLTASTGYTGGSLTEAGKRAIYGKGDSGLFSADGSAFAGYYNAPDDLGIFNDDTIVWYSMKEYPNDVENPTYWYCNIDGYVKDVEVNIYYHPNYTGATGYKEVTTKTGAEHQVLTYAATDLTARSGYTFTGWNTKADGTGETYTAGQKITVTGPMSLYAQWDEIKYTPSEQPTATLTLKKTWASGITSGEAVTITLEDASGNSYTAKENGGEVTPGTPAKLTFEGLTPGATYTIKESPETYILDETQVKLEPSDNVGFALIRNASVEEPCNSTTKDLKGSNIAIVKKGGDYLIWTAQPVTGYEDQLRTDANEIVSGKDMTSNNTVFISGKQTEYTWQGEKLTFDPAGTVSFTGGPHMWSLIWFGEYSYSYGEPAEAYLTVKNSPKVGTLTISKTFSYEGIDTTTAPTGFGATFVVKNESETPVASLTYADLSDLTKNPITNLPYGTYTVEETNITGTLAPAYNPNPTVSYDDGTTGEGKTDNQIALNAPTATMEVNNHYSLTNSPIVGITKTATPTATAGDTITYTITVTNTGGGMATEVEVTDTLPDGLVKEKSEDVTLNCPEGTDCSYDPQTGTVTWTIPSLAAQTGKAELTVQVQVADSALSLEKITNTAYMKTYDGYQGDPIPASAETKITKSNLSIAKSASSSSDESGATAKPGDTITYTITVTNTGDAAAKGKTVIDTLPSAGLQNINAGTGTYNKDQNTITWRDLTIPAGETVTLTVTADVAPLANTSQGITLVNKVKMDDLSDSVTTRVGATTATLTIEKYVTGLPAADTAAWNALVNAVSFTVTGQPESGGTFTPVTVDLDQFQNTASGVYTYSLENLAPGTYTVTENGYDVLSTYGYTWNAENSAASVEKTVTAGVPASAAIRNEYDSREFTIIFDSNTNGVLLNRDRSTVAMGDSFRYGWIVPTGNETVSTGPSWAGALVGETFNGSPNSQVSYTFTKAEYLEYGNHNTYSMAFSQPGVTANDGYSFTGSFTTTGAAEGMKFESLANTMAYLLASDQDQITYYANYTANGTQPNPDPIEPGPNPDPIEPGPSDPGTDIPDDNTPTTDLPEEETPTTELPDEETPMTEEPVEELPEEEVPLAEVPATGDTAGLWALAAGVSGLALVWLALSGKKRREENA